MKRGIPILYLTFLLVTIFSTQKSIGQKSLLNEFSRQKNAKWTLEKRKADSTANMLGITVFYVGKDSNKVVILQRLGRKNKPVYYSTDNIDAAETISVDDVWTSNNAFPSLTGEGIEINLWDGGAIRATHQELQNSLGSRIIMRDLELPLSSHSTHIAGTMIASGVNAAAKGMAGKAIVKGWDLNDDIAEMSGAAADGIVLSNHSYGPICGWDYNSLNESWYWYGDLEISTTEDHEFGFYNQVSADLDYIAQLAPNYLIIKSAGNDRNDGPTTSFVHYVWDETWKLVDIEREPDGGTDGFDCLTPMAVAKNILTVGAVDDARAMTSFSAFGPTDDGRIKPDVVANGSDVFSSASATDNSYATYSGTSMSTASVTGSVALLHQLQSTVQPGRKLLSSTIKGLLIHTASDLGNAGPDYRFGWGLLNIKEAADLIYANSNNQGNNIYEEVLANDGEIVIPVTTLSAPFLKVTICWTDPAGQASSPSLNSRNSKLVNDLNVLVENSISLETYKPWILDVENPELAAAQNINHIDNVEQIYLANPGDNNFNIKISHSGVLSEGPQQFSVIISGIETTSNIFPPKNLTYIINESSVLLNWDPPESGTPELYKIYRNGNLLAVTENYTFHDQSIVLDNIYEYYITAEYELNDEIFESIGTNLINVFPQTLRSLPFIVDFEQESNEILIQNSLDGWQWGDSESLNCYYLDFSDNTTKFIGIDSYSAGEAIHVSDIAITAPLRLADYNNISLSFDYLLKTGIYDAIDELHVVYKLQEEEEWHELKKLDKAFDWTYHSFELAPEMCKNGTQIGFYYDDFYQWGMGAALDNIQLTGTLIIQDDISIESITEPANSQCVTSNAQDLTFSIKNTGTTTISSGETLEITSSCNGIQKVSNYTITSDLSIGMTQSITFQNLIGSLPVGTHTLSVGLTWPKDQNVTNNTKSKAITVFGLPDVEFMDPPAVLCENGGTVELTATPTGGTFTGDFLAGNIFNASEAGVGEYEIIYTLTDLNGCTNSISTSIEVVPLPEVSFTGLQTNYCLNDPIVALTGTPSSGIFSGTGILNDTFNPQLSGSGTHIVEYHYTDENGCSNSIQQQTIVYDLTSLSFTNLEETYCQNGEPIQLTALPNGGIFYINDQIKSILNPEDYPPESLDIKYTFQDEHNCISTITENVTIFTPPEVSIIDPANPLCFIDLNIPLEGIPIGGVFIGNLISENTFNSVHAGIGEHDIIYKYEDANGCANEDTITIEVVPLPEVSFSGLSTQYCVNEASSLLIGDPTGGVFEGYGILENSFHPEVAGVGILEINYVYTDNNGCENSSSHTTTVINLTDIEILNLEEDYCQYNDPIELSASPPEGIFYVEGIEENTLIPNKYAPGIIEVSYEYLDENSCISNTTKTIEILALPDVSIDGLSEMYCIVDEDYILNGTPEGGNFSLEGEEISSINPFNLGEGNYELLYKYEDGEGCAESIAQSFSVNSEPALNIEGLSSSYCPNDPPVLLTGIPSGGFFEGDGIAASIFSPELLLPGTFTISYVYNMNGCELSTSTSTEITEPIQVSIENLQDEYCPIDSLVGISGIPSGGTFSAIQEPPELPNLNSYMLNYTFIDQYNCTFTASSNFQVAIKPEFPFPQNIELTEMDTIVLTLEDPDLLYFWPNDSTSNSINLIGSLYPTGWNGLPVTLQDDNGCLNNFELEFFIDGVTGLNKDSKSPTIVLYPNPANNYINILLNQEMWVATDGEILITDLNGRIINNWIIYTKNEPHLSLDVSHLIDGTYLMILSDQKRNYRAKFSILH